MERTLFVGIGAPKTGTSWLYGYLLRHPEVFMSPLKEVHHFGARFGPNITTMARGVSLDDTFRQRAAEMQAKYDESHKPWQLRHLAALNARVAMINDPSAYMAYFNSAAGPQHKVMGEISPSYCWLPEAGFEAIRSQSSNLRVLFLMRDPVDWVWSGMRFLQRKQSGYNAIAKFDSVLAELTGRRYDRTLQIMDRIFAPDQIRCEFFERLFTPQAISGICNWLGIDFIQPEFDRIVNGSPRIELPPELEAKARETFAPVYDYCKERFGDALPKGWRA